MSADRLIRLHKALSDETRLRILNALAALGELCVCDIEAGLDLPQSTTSRHLGVLRQAGLVADRRDGTWVYYRISDDLDMAASAALTAISETFGRTKDAKAEVARTKSLRRSC